MYRVLKHSKSSQPVALKWLPCSSGFQCGHFSRSFHIKILHYYVPDLTYSHCLLWAVNIRWTVSMMTFHTEVGCHTVLTGERMLMCWRQFDPLKRWCICTSCHNVASWKTQISSHSTWILKFSQVPHCITPLFYNLFNFFCWVWV
jgi:hypothetical protein